MRKTVIHLAVVLSLTVGMFWAAENVGFGNKISMVFSMQEQGSMHNPPPATEPGSSADTGINDQLIEHGHGPVSVVSILQNILSYIILLAWVTASVFSLEKLLRYLSKKRKPGTRLAESSE